MEQLKSQRPEIKGSTIERLHRSGKYPPNTSIDYIINDVLDRCEGKRK